MKPQLERWLEVTFDRIAPVFGWICIGAVAILFGEIIRLWLQGSR